MRDSAAGVSYLQSDHLGIASVSTNASGVLTSWQRFDPWGKVRASSSTMPTKRTFTGQYLDDTGLLFYNARYYDPGIGRFVSADSIVPGNASGGMAGIAYKPLTVDFHENGFVAAVNRENQFGPWFTLSDDAKQQLGAPWGPANPQALNRYSYVLNNPLKWTDPSGHTWYMDFTTANQLEGALREFAAELSMPGNVMTGISALGALAGLITKSVGLGAAAVAAIVEATIAAATAALPLIAGLLTVNYVAGIATELADMIDKANQPGADGMAYGIAVQFNNGYLYAMNRATGQIYSTSIPFWMSIPGYLAPGIYHSFQKTLPVNSYYFWNDRNAVPWSPSICWPGRGVCQKHGEPMQ